MKQAIKFILTRWICCSVSQLGSICVVQNSLIFAIPQHETWVHLIKNVQPYTIEREREGGREKNACINFSTLATQTFFFLLLSLVRLFFCLSFISRKINKVMCCGCLWLVYASLCIPLFFVLFLFRCCHLVQCLLPK